MYKFIEKAKQIENPKIMEGGVTELYISSLSYTHCQIGWLMSKLFTPWAKLKIEFIFLSIHQYLPSTYSLHATLLDDFI